MEWFNQQQRELEQEELSSREWRSNQQNDDFIHNSWDQDHLDQDLNDADIKQWIIDPPGLGSSSNSQMLSALLCWKSLGVSKNLQQTSHLSKNSPFAKKLGQISMNWVGEVDLPIPRTPIPAQLTAWMVSCPSQHSPPPERTGFFIQQSPWSLDR